MRQQTVIAKAYAEAAGDPPKDKGGNKIRPAKSKKCGDRKDMKYDDTDDGRPVQRFSNRVEFYR